MTYPDDTRLDGYTDPFTARARTGELEPYTGPRIPSSDGFLSDDARTLVALALDVEDAHRTAQRVRERRALLEGIDRDYRAAWEDQRDPGYQAPTEVTVTPVPLEPLPRRSFRERFDVVRAAFVAVILALGGLAVWVVVELVTWLSQAASAAGHAVASSMPLIAGAGICLLLLMLLGGGKGGGGFSGTFTGRMH